MSRLNELIQELCPDGVEYETIKETVGVNRGKRLTKSQLSDDGKYEVYHGSKDSILGKYYEYNAPANTVIVINTGGIGGVKFLDKPFWCSDGSFWLGQSSRINNKYLYYYLSGYENYFYSQKRVGGVPTIERRVVEDFKIPIPPLDVQNEIVRILDTFTSHTAELQTKLQAELQARKEQYKYYRNKLLTFDKDDKNVKWMKLGEIGTFIRGNGLQKKDFTETGFPCIHYGQIHTHYGTFADTTISHTSFVLAEKLRKASYGDLVIATTSEDVDGVCKACAWLGKNDVAVSGDAYIYKHNQNPKYISYLFQTKRFYEYKRKASVGTKVVRVSGDSMKNFIFPIPSISEQTRIVSILDKFEALVNDLTEGIPAEIAAVQEQYEYYRNKLLTFKQRA